MTTCDIDHRDCRNNGLLTEIWGSSGWIFNHSITFGYPIQPTEEQKIRYKNYFISLGDVLPCRLCRESYQKLISGYPNKETALTNEVMKNRETLTRWFYRVHQAVNNKLGVDYGVSYEDLVDKYECFRAKCKSNHNKGCVVPLYLKSISFKKLYQKDAPIVSLRLVKSFVKLAKIKKVDKIYFTFYKLACKLDGDIDALKKQKCWPYRNKFCSKLIKYMRESAIPSIEIVDTSSILHSNLPYNEKTPSGEMPTLHELILILHLSSNLSLPELEEIARNISPILDNAKLSDDQE